MLKFTPIVIFLATAVPATAQIPATSSSTAIAPVKVDPLDKIICRTEEGLGSRLNKKKVCMSLRDWKDQAQDARDATEKMQQMNTQTPSGG